MNHSNRPTGQHELTYPEQFGAKLNDTCRIHESPTELYDHNSLLKIEQLFAGNTVNNPYFNNGLNECTFAVLRESASIRKPYQFLEGQRFQTLPRRRCTLPSSGALRSAIPCTRGTVAVGDASTRRICRTRDRLYYSQHNCRTCDRVAFAFEFSRQANGIM